MNKTLGQLVKEAMAARSIKGYELALLIGKQTSYVSRLTNDEIKETLPVSDMEALERELGIPQAAMLRALGYQVTVDAKESTAFPYDSERAALAVLLDKLSEGDARVLRATARAIIEEREAKNVSALDDRFLVPS